MPRLSRWFLRCALIYLSLGFTFGALILWHKGMPIDARVWLLLPAHIEFLLMGWVLQLIFGVGYWILPRFRTKRGRTRFAWWAFGLINGGVWAVALAPVTPYGAALTTTGRVAEVIAAAAFAAHAWPRIKPPGL